MAGGGIRVGELSGSDAIDRLHETIKLQTAAANKQTETMVRLTWWITVLSVVMALSGVAQVLLPLFK